MKFGYGVWMVTVFLLRIQYPLQAQQERPNVIVILTDDQGWGDIGYNGNSYLHTPYIDSFAASSVSLTNFFVNPVCAPTRASLLTGRYNLSTGVSGVSNGWERMHAEEYTLGELFSDNGYATACFGKWHNGGNYPEDPNGQGFKEFFGFTAGHWSTYYDALLQYNQRMAPTRGYITDILTDSAISFFRRNRSRPFFCYIPYNAPHEPFQVPGPYWKKFLTKGLDTATSVVYGMCESLDKNIGRLFSELQRLHLAENTIIWMTSDNGPALKHKRYNGGLKGGKGTIDEGGSKVFSFLKWGNKMNPGAITMPTGGIDLFPTLQKLCRLVSNGGKQVDGIDLSKIINRQEPERGYRSLFLNHSIGALSPFPGSVRTERYRLQLYKDHLELYDMEKDPSQTNNIAVQHGHLTDSLKEAYLEWYSRQKLNSISGRPIPVGYAAAPLCRLMATEASFGGGIHYAYLDGYAHDYLTGWSSLRDSIAWQVDVHEPGFYTITLRYSTKKGHYGSVFRIKAGDRRQTAVINRPFDGLPYPTRDIIPPAGAAEKPWGRLQTRKVFLRKGIQMIVLSAVTIKNKDVADIYSVELMKDNCLNQ